MGTQARNKGFTLIEILVVMLIISIVAGVAALTVNFNQRKQFETFSNQLVNVISLAEQEAMLRPGAIGMGISDSAFQFFILRRDFESGKSSWQPLANNLGEHKIPRNTELTLVMDEEKTPNDGQPHLVIAPSGDITPFTLYVGQKGKDPYFQIIGKSNGEIRNEVFQAE